MHEFSTTKRFNKKKQNTIHLVPTFLVLSFLRGIVVCWILWPLRLQRLLINIGHNRFIIDFLDYLSVFINNTFLLVESSPALSAMPFIFLPIFVIFEFFSWMVTFSFSYFFDPISNKHYCSLTDKSFSLDNTTKSAYIAGGK